MYNTNNNNKKGDVISKANRLLTNTCQVSSKPDCDIDDVIKTTTLTSFWVPVHCQL